MKVYLPMTAMQGKSLLTLHRKFKVEIGTATDPGYWTAPHRSRLREFTSLTPECCMKWEVIHPHPDIYNFGPGDQICDQGKSVHGHTLVWHLQNPPWLVDLSGSNLRSALSDHITTVLDHYRGRVKSWDVVNEAWHADGHFISSIWSERIGFGYPTLAFKLARRADPDALLFYNSHVHSTGKWQERALALGREGLLDGIGLQMHLYLVHPNYSELKRFFDRLYTANIQFRVTEMDVKIKKPVDEWKLALQADIYEQVFRTCAEYPNFKGFTVWGLSDAVSWVSGWYPGYGHATLFDNHYRPKPAYHRLVNVAERS